MRRLTALGFVASLVAAGCSSTGTVTGANGSPCPNRPGSNAVGCAAVALPVRSTTATTLATTAIAPVPTTVSAATTVDGPLPLPTVIPKHGIAYSTGHGFAVAGVDGSLLFDMSGWRIVDRSWDFATIAAIVSPSRAEPNPVGQYALLLGTATMAPVFPTASSGTNVQGWTERSAPAGCLRDERRAGASLLLCDLNAEGLARSIARQTPDGAVLLVAAAPATVVAGSGHWIDAFGGPDGSVAATWSGDCESLVAYRITPDGAMAELSAQGGSYAQSWIDDDLLVSRFSGCGPSGSTDGLYRVTPDGTATRIPTPTATEVPVTW